MWRWQWLEQLVQDSRYAIRVLRRRPAYALLSMLTLALGIGGTASVYGVARGVLFDPLPFAHEREVGVFWKKTDWTHEEYLYIRGRVPGFSQVALFRQRDVIVREGDGPARLVRGSTHPPNSSTCSARARCSDAGSMRATMSLAPSRSRY